MRAIAIALLFTASTLAQDPASNAALDRAKQLTVMINATIDGDMRPGAGIIFGSANNQIYIATANHLVRRGLSRASQIQVEFQWLPGQPLPAQLLTYFDDRALDLAVIVVDGVRARVPQGGLPQDRMGDPATLTRGSSVFAIGYPNGSAYDVSAGQVNQVEAVSVKYRVPGLVPGGYSGGPLVDRNGMIVGIIRQDQPPNGEATRIDLVINQLKAWGYQVAASDPFQVTLLRMVTEAQSGFRGIGAPQSGVGTWNPSITFPGLIQENVADRPLHCEGTAQPAIKCILYISHERDLVIQKFEEVSREVKAALPAAEWQVKEHANPADGSRELEYNKPPIRVLTSMVFLGNNYNVTIEVNGVRQQANGDPTAASTGDPFRDTLLRYIAEAPSGFRGLGAKQIGDWSPSVALPDAINCRGGGREAFIECLFYRTSSEVEAADDFENLIDVVQAALPGWKGSRLNLFNAYFRKTPDGAVIVDLGVAHRGDHYDVTVSVRRIGR